MPYGSPVAYDYNVCSGGNSTGNEQTKEECNAQGGTFSKYNQVSTQVKIKYYKNAESVIDNIQNKDLYYKKYNDSELIKQLPDTKEIVSDEEGNAQNSHAHLLTEEEDSELLNLSKKSAEDNAVNNAKKMKLYQFNRFQLNKQQLPIIITVVVALLLIMAYFLYAKYFT